MTKFQKILEIERKLLNDEAALLKERERLIELNRNELEAYAKNLNEEYNLKIESLKSEFKEKKKQKLIEQEEELFKLENQIKETIVNKINELVDEIFKEVTKI